MTYFMNFSFLFHSISFNIPRSVSKSCRSIVAVPLLEIAFSTFMINCSSTVLMGVVGGPFTCFEEVGNCGLVASALCHGTASFAMGLALRPRSQL